MFEGWIKFYDIGFTWVSESTIVGFTGGGGGWGVGVVGTTRAWCVAADKMDSSRSIRSIRSRFPFANISSTICIDSAKETGPLPKNPIIMGESKWSDSYQFRHLASLLTWAYQDLQGSQGAWERDLIQGRRDCVRSCLIQMNPNWDSLQFRSRSHHLHLSLSFCCLWNIFEFEYYSFWLYFAYLFSNFSNFFATL